MLGKVNASSNYASCSNDKQSWHIFENAALGSVDACRLAINASERSFGTYYFTAMNTSQVPAD